MELKNENIFIEKVRKGDSESYRVLVDNYKDMVYSIALKLVKNHEDAEELSMDAFVKAYEKIDSFRGDSAFSTWLYRIVYNLSLSRLRKKNLNTFGIDEKLFQVRDDNQKTPFEQLLKNEKEMIVHDAISKLDVEGGKIISLFYFEDRKMKEIAEIMKLSESNVKVKLFRSRKKLYELLSVSGELFHEI